MTNGVQITVVGNPKSYHTWRDWHLAMETASPIGDIEQETAYVDVPGADGFLDYSEVLTGYPVFKSRTIEAVFGILKPKKQWQSFISRLRLLLEGKVCQLVFDDYPGYYWQGRVHITDCSRTGTLGQFKLTMETAEPYGIAVQGNNDPWLWDPFDFEYDTIEDIGFTITNGNKTVLIESKGGPFPINCVVSGASNLQMTVNGDTYVLTNGLNEFGFRIRQDTTLTFTGTGNVTVNYRRRVL